MVCSLTQLNSLSQLHLLSMNSKIESTLHENSPESHMSSVQSEGSLYSVESFSGSSDGSLSSVSSDCSSIWEGKISTKSSLSYHCIHTLTGHVDSVSSIAIAGKLLYSASQGNDVRIWRHSDNMAECGRFGFGEGAVKAILIVGERVFCAHQDHKIRVWRRSNSNPAAHKLVATLPTLKDYAVNCISQKNYVQVRRHHRSLWLEHVDTISVLAAGKNNLLYSASWDKTFKVWRLSDLKCVESVKAHDNAINSLILGPDEFIYTASADCRVKVWKKKNGNKKHSLVATLEGHKSAVTALALSPDGATLYSGGSDGHMIVWEREDSIGHMRAVRVVRAHRLAILCLGTAAGNLVISGSADKTIRAWKMEAGDGCLSCVAVLKGHKAGVKPICVCRDMVARGGGGGGWLVYEYAWDVAYTRLMLALALDLRTKDSN